MTNFGERFSQRKWVFSLVAIVIAIGSLYIAYESARDANRALQIEEQHYQELTKPHTLEQETKDKLDILDRMMSRAERWVIALKDQGQDIPNLALGLTDASSFRTQAESYFIDGKLIDAENEIQNAVDLLSRILDTSFDTSFSSVIVKASGTLLIGIEIDPETIGKTSDGLPLTRITLAADNVPSSTQDGYFVVSAVDLMPNGATLNRPITVRVNYDPGNIPRGVEEKRLVLAAWDNDRKEWIKIRYSQIDLNTNIITGRITRLSPVAVLAKTPAQNYVPSFGRYHIAGVVVVIFSIAVILLALFVPLKKKPSIGFKSGN